MTDKPKRTMSADHKKALEEGRMWGRAIGDYLDAVAAHKPKRGRKRTPETVERQMQEIDDTVGSATGTARVEMVQRRRDLEVELASLSAQVDITLLEAGFIQYGKDYAARKRISFAAFREVGVPAEVLEKAGITR